MKYILIAATILAAFAAAFMNFSGQETEREEVAAPQQTEERREINDIVKKGESFYNVFRRYGLDMVELFRIKEAAAAVHRLKKVRSGQPYRIVLDTENKVDSLTYWIDDDSILNITRNEDGFTGERIVVDYEKRTEHVGGIIRDNLVSSVGEGSENYLLALKLSEILAWDIDFTSDLRNGDEFKIVVEGLYREGKFRKYGEIISAEFVNNGKLYSAYRFSVNGKTSYYDASGKALKKAFLKAPLNFKRISSYFSANRFHPVLKKVRAHKGLDYAAPTGTPVSAVGDGTVSFAGRKGQYGNLVIISHRNSWSTYYGHLSKIDSSARRGSTVDQGQVIGYVGSTGLATGPHLHYEVRIGKQPSNPLKIKFPGGDPIPGPLMAEFRKLKNSLDQQLASINPAVFASQRKSPGNRI